MAIRPDFKNAAAVSEAGKRRIGPIRLLLLLFVPAIVAFVFWNAQDPLPEGGVLERPVADENPSPKPEKTDLAEPDPGSLAETQQRAKVEVRKAPEFAAPEKIEPAEEKAEQKTAEQKKTKTKAVKAKKIEKKTKKQAKTEPDEPPARRYDFYRMLRDYEVEIPAEETVTKKKPKPTAEDREKAKQERPKTGVYMLQVGSFRTRAQADSLRGELALLGLEAAIKAVTSKDGSVWQRVQVGPYGDVTEREAVIENLEANGHQPILVKLAP